MSNLYLVRHGYYDHKDGSLTMAGVKQAIAEGSFDEQVENWLREDLAI